MERGIEHYLDLDRSPLAWDKDRLLSDRPGKWELSMAAFEGGRPVGLLLASLRSPRRPHIHLLLVHEGHRSVGVGQALLEAYRTHSPWPVTTLKVSRENEGAIRFYRRNGFRILTRKGDYLWLAAGKK
jgi:ribosomal protein S18 acetylase RimI-like enzyme